MDLVVGVHAGRELLRALLETRERLWVCCPFIGRSVAEILASQAHARDFKVIARPENLEALEVLGRAGAQVRVMENLHAKIYVADDTAFIGSANLTESGVYVNVELVAALRRGRDPEYEDVVKAFELLWAMSSRPGRGARRA